MKDNNNHQLPSPAESPDPVLDPLLLDRLVDDELNATEYRQVLRLVEEKPDGWRQLALAFLESQAWNKDLSAWHPDTQNPLVPPATPPGKMPGSTATPTGDGAAPGESIAKKSGSPAAPSANSASLPPTGSRLRFARALPAIAACFALAFAAGLYLQEIQRSRPGRISSAESRSGSDATVPPDYIELVSNDAAARVQTPVFSHQKFDPRLHANEVDRLTPELRKVVAQSGWQANEKNHLVPIKDPTGNKIIVPLKEIKLAPRKFEDYQ